MLFLILFASLPVSSFPSPPTSPYAVPEEHKGKCLFFLFLDMWKSDGISSIGLQEWISQLHDMQIDKAESKEASIFLCYRPSKHF
jgi:hypothetical protein